MKAPQRKEGRKGEGVLREDISNYEERGREGGGDRTANKVKQGREGVGWEGEYWVTNC